jgi:hypothetical protein
VLLGSKRHLARDTRIALHAGFALHELKSLFGHFADLYSFNRTHAALNAPGFLRPMLPMLPEIIYDYLLPTNVIIGRK